nr:hypothetical protein ctg1_3446 [Streptomyces sp.]
MTYSRGFRDKKRSARTENPSGPIVTVGLTGFEPVASSLSGMRSNQLSYSPAALCEVSRALTPED